MNFLSSSYKKYFIAAATAFAAIAIPAQATDCTTICQNAAAQAGNAAVQQQQTASLDYCKAHFVGGDMTTYMNSCMMGQVPKLQAAYDQAYQQTLSQCSGSCH